MARAASVTVSIAEEQSGIWSRMLRVNWVEVSVSDGKTSERAGIKSTSSNVRPSVISAEIIRALLTAQKLITKMKPVSIETELPAIVKRAVLKQSLSPAKFLRS